MEYTFLSRKWRKQTERRVPKQTRIFDLTYISQYTLFSETISCLGRDCKGKLYLMEIRLKGFILLFNTLKTPFCVCLVCLISARYCTLLYPCNPTFLSTHVQSATRDKSCLPERNSF